MYPSWAFPRLIIEYLNKVNNPGGCQCELGRSPHDYITCFWWLNHVKHILECLNQLESSIASWSSRHITSRHIHHTNSFQLIYTHTYVYIYIHLKVTLMKSAILPQRFLFHSLPFNLFHLLSSGLRWIGPVTCAQLQTSSTAVKLPGHPRLEPVLQVSPPAQRVEI